MKINRALQLLAVVALGVLGAVTAGVVAQASTATTTKTTINVTEREYSIKLSGQKAPVGIVHFVIRNRGRYSHALSIKDGSFSKRIALIKPGKTGTLTVNLKKGKVSIWCPVPGHAALGMKATLAVGVAAAPTTPSTTVDTTTTNYIPPTLPGY
jgi:plastocyanin